MTTVQATETTLPAVLHIDSLAEVLGVSEIAVRKWRRAGKLPPAIKLAGGKLLAWTRADIEAWLEECREPVGPKWEEGAEGEAQ